MTLSLGNFLFKKAKNYKLDLQCMYDTKLASTL